MSEHSTIDAPERAIDYSHKGKAVFGIALGVAVIFLLPINQSSAGLIKLVPPMAGGFVVGIIIPRYGCLAGLMVGLIGAGISLSVLITIAFKNTGDLFGLGHKWLLLNLMTLQILVAAGSGGLGSLLRSLLIHRERKLFLQGFQWSRCKIFLAFSFGFFLGVLAITSFASYQNRQHAIDLFIQGIEASHMGKSEQAIAFLQKAQFLYPDWADPYLHLGNLYRQKGLSAKAKEEYQNALTLEPTLKKIIEPHIPPPQQ